MKKLILFMTLLILFVLVRQDGYAQCGNCATCVSLQNQKLKYQGTDFFPKVLNFGVEVTYWQNGIYQGYHLGANHSYFVNNPSGSPATEENCVCGGTNDPSWCLDQIQLQLDQISGMGFNAIRLCGLTAGGPSEDPQPPLDPDDFGTQLLIRGTNYNPSAAGCEEGAQTYELVLNTPAVMNLYFSWVEAVLTMANNAQPNPLKVILVAGNGRAEGVRDAQYTAYGQKYQEFLNQLSCRLAGNPALLAYDLYNEPSDDKQSAISGPKSTLCNMVTGWYNTIKQNDPDHLVTIGLGGPGDVFKYDPGIMKVDFISFHIYPDLKGVYNNNTNYNNALQRIYTDYKWIEDNVRTPWIVGETGISSREEPDPEGTPLCDQESFLNQQTHFHETLLKARDCGGLGYSWWDYKDVRYDNLCSGSGNFYGLIGRNLNSNKQLTFVTNEFTNFDPITINPSGCPFPANYYNPYNYSTYTYTGTVKDQNNQVIKGAVVAAWDNAFGNPKLTITKPDGTFILSSDIVMDKMFISAINSDIYEIWGSLPSNIGTVVLNYGGAGTNVPDKQISGVTVTNGTTYNMDAYNSITVNSMTVNSGANAYLNAGYNVKMLPGFTALNGSTFKARLANYNSSCSINARLAESEVIHNRLPTPNYSLRPKDEMLLRQANNKTESGLQVFPNPSNGKFQVGFTALTDRPVHVDIYDLFGNLVFSDIYNVKKNQEYKFEVALKTNVTSSYVLKLSDFDKFKTVRKITVVK